MPAAFNAFFSAATGHAPGRSDGHDVAEPRSPQQRIAKRVGHHVAVRMPHWALLVRHFNSPDDQLAPFGQAMQVIANAAAVAHAFFCSAWR